MLFFFDFTEKTQSGWAGLELRLTKFKCHNDVITQYSKHNYRELVFAAHTQFSVSRLSPFSYITPCFLLQSKVDSYKSTVTKLTRQNTQRLDTYTVLLQEKKELEHMLNSRQKSLVRINNDNTANSSLTRTNQRWYTCTPLFWGRKRLCLLPGKKIKVLAH